MKSRSIRWTEIAIITVLVTFLSGALTMGLLVAQTSIFEIAAALGFRSINPQVRWVGNLTMENLDGTDVAELTDTGILQLVENSNLPETTELSSDAEVAMFTCEDTLIFAYNNGGTMTYISLDLDGSDTSFTHGTSTLNFNSCTQ